MKQKLTPYIYVMCLSDYGVIRVYTNYKTNIGIKIQININKYLVNININNLI